MSKPKLMLADDSVTIQKVVNLTFADQGMEVTAFGDGDSAIGQLDAVRPDIVLADVHMPGMSGYRMCELIRGNQETRDLPVVLLVGSFEAFDREEAERVGASAYLTKPFSSIRELVSTVENLLAPKTASDEAPSVDTPAPDTLDIDTLYEKSFAETMELPDQGAIEYQADEYDDEMIQTSYAEPDMGPVVDDLYAEGAEAHQIAPSEIEDLEAESLIAESMSTDSAWAAFRGGVEPTSADIEATSDSSDAQHEVESAERSKTDEEPETEGPALSFASAEVEVANADPFGSIASEPGPVPAGLEPRGGRTEAFDESDILELPGDFGGASQGVGNTREIASLSPELIELIVEKVLDRLAEKDAAARSVAGS